MPGNQLGRIEHVVALVLENRSFDNLLGWLYDPANPAPFNRTPPSNFEGCYGKNLSNPTPDGQSLAYGKGSDPTAPFPDPGEVFQEVYAQIYGQKETVTANAVTSLPPRPCNMRGFVYNYALRNQGNPANLATIMKGFTPAVVPVLSSLAHYYGVCDHWFASVPSQTLCNRSFLQAGTSSGYVNNDGNDGILFINNTPTVYNMLSGAGKSWKVYCGGWTITSLVLLTQMHVWEFALRSGYFEHLSDFFADAKKPGGLPAYSFIEPNYIDSIVHGPQNDMHPESHEFQLYGRSNVEQGDKLAYDVYNAIRNSPDWDKILLLILFDEHGGNYDHVCPPTSKECALAISPDGIVIPPGQPGGTGFAFDRLGVRVPAIVVSAYTPQERAPDVSEALTLLEPRADRPAIPLPGAATIGLEKRVVALGAAIAHAQSKPISGLQQKILVGSAKRLGLSEEQQRQIANTSTSLEADAELLKLEAQLAMKRVGKKL
jgi:phospholipase C